MNNFYSPDHQNMSYNLHFYMRCSHHSETHSALCNPKDTISKRKSQEGAGPPVQGKENQWQMTAKTPKPFVPPKAWNKAILKTESLSLKRGKEARNDREGN